MSIPVKYDVFIASGRAVVSSTWPGPVRRTFCAYRTMESCSSMTSLVTLSATSVWGR